MIKTVGFVGMGLMGGAIAKSIKKYHVAEQIIAYNRNPDNLKPAIDEGVVDRQVFEVGEGFSECDIIFLCCPINVNIQMAKQLAPYISRDCILTDVGSTKNDIHEAMGESAPEVCFIGGHPMTGSEKTGYLASSTQLFENICYVLAPGDTSREQDLDKMIHVVKAIKSIPIVIDPKLHDQATAAISHMPQLLSVALVNAVKDMDDHNGFMKVLAAGGFKDMSRIAASSPAMWAPIFTANREAILHAVDRIESELKTMKKVVEDNDIDSIYKTFESAGDYRSTMAFNHRGLIQETFSFSVDVDDTPGIIARISTILYEAGMNLKNIGIVNKRENDEGALEIHFEDKEHMDESAKLLDEMGYVIHTKN